MTKQKDHKKHEKQDEERAESSFAEIAEALNVDLNQSTKTESLEELQAKRDEAVQKAQDNWDKYLRTQAEMENLRKRAERDIANAHRFSLEKFVKELLPVLDSFEQGLHISKNSAEELAAMREGMELTYTMLVKVLEKFGIEQIHPLDAVYDPHLHEAMSMVYMPDLAANTVIQVIQNGYVLHGRLVRPARVIISKTEENT